MKKVSIKVHVPLRVALQAHAPVYGDSRWEFSEGDLRLLTPADLETVAMLVESDEPLLLSGAIYTSENYDDLETIRLAIYAETSRRLEATE